MNFEFTYCQIWALRRRNLGDILCDTTQVERVRPNVFLNSQELVQYFANDQLLQRFKFQIFFTEHRVRRSQQAGHGPVLLKQKAKEQLCTVHNVTLKLLLLSLLLFRNKRITSMESKLAFVLFPTKRREIFKISEANNIKINSNLSTKRSQNGAGPRVLLPAVCSSTSSFVFPSAVSALQLGKGQEEKSLSLQKYIAFV